MLQRGGLGLPRVAAVVLLPGALLPIHVGPAFASWRCTYAAHLGKFNVLIPSLLLKSGQIQSAKAAKKPMDINETLTRTESESSKLKCGVHVAWQRTEGNRSIEADWSECDPSGILVYVL